MRQERDRDLLEPGRPARPDRRPRSHRSSWPDGCTGITGRLRVSRTHGAPGTNGADGKTVLNGVATPTNNLGSIGDFYLDTALMKLYGPKTANGWGNGTSLVGPPGDSGSVDDVNANVALLFREFAKLTVGAVDNGFGSWYLYPVDGKFLAPGSHPTVHYTENGEALEYTGLGTVNENGRFFLSVEMNCAQTNVYVTGVTPYGDTVTSNAIPSGPFC